MEFTESLFSCKFLVHARKCVTFHFILTLKKLCDLSSCYVRHSIGLVVRRTLHLIALSMRWLWKNLILIGHFYFTNLLFWCSHSDARHYHLLDDFDRNKCLLFQLYIYKPTNCWQIFPVKRMCERQNQNLKK